MIKARLLRRGLDALVSSLAAYAMVVGTPAGGLVLAAVRHAAGIRAPGKPLIAYFEIDNAGPALLARMASVVPPSPPRFAEPNAALPIPELRAPLARALIALGTTSGVLALPEGAQAALAGVGVAWPPANPSPEARESALIAGTAALARSLGGEEAGIAALVVEPAAIQFAVERARASGVESPAEYARFRPFLPLPSRARVDPFLDSAFALAAAYDFGQPLATPARISSRFGPREHPMLKQPQLHTGVDLAVPNGTEIRAAQSGRVELAGEDSMNGKFIRVSHGHGLSTAYCHASRLEVARGQEVQKGQLLARSGETGKATGPHLHFQVELDRHPVDPELFLKDLGTAGPGGLGGD